MLFAEQLKLVVLRRALLRDERIDKLIDSAQLGGAKMYELLVGIMLRFILDLAVFFADVLRRSQRLILGAAAGQQTLDELRAESFRASAEVAAQRLLEHR